MLFSQNILYIKIILKCKKKEKYEDSDAISLKTILLFWLFSSWESWMILQIGICINTLTYKIDMFWLYSLSLKRKIKQPLKDTPVQDESKKSYIPWCNDYTVMLFTECLRCAKHCANKLICMIFINSYNNSMK